MDESTLALLKSKLPGNLSVYQLKGSGKIVIRRKGGPGAKKIRHSPRFENTRRVQAEFGGCSSATKAVRRILAQQKPWSDFDFGPAIVSRLTKVVKKDTVSEYGKRHIRLSQHTEFLAGLSLTRYRPGLDAVILQPLTWTIVREEQTATVTLPLLQPNVNFMPAAGQSMVRIVVSLGVVPDMFYHDTGYRPSHKAYDQANYAVITTDWYSVKEGIPAQTLTLRCPMVPPDEQHTLVLSVGVCYGVMYGQTTMEVVKDAGCAKVVGCVG